MSAPETLAISPTSSVNVNELSWRYARSSGPGGQHANTSNTRVEVALDLTSSTSISANDLARLRAKFGHQVQVAVEDTRSQARNRDIALERLQTQLKQALVRRKTRRKTKPSKGANERRLRAKREQSQRKADRRGNYD